MTVWKWSTTASSNNTADSTINLREGQAPSTLNDAQRGAMAAIAKFRDDISGKTATGGTSTAYTLTTSQVFTSLSDGLLCGCEFHATCGATPTINVDGLGAKTLRPYTSGSFSSGDLAAGMKAILCYDSASTSWVVVGQLTQVIRNTTLTSEDFNAITTTGFYRINTGHSNMPTGVGFGQLIVSRGLDTILQIASDYGGTYLYFRNGNPSDVGGAGSWSSWRKVWHDANDGSGSTLDADLLDGQEGSYYLPAATYTSGYTAADVLTKIKTVDGSGSGLDADLLDGNDSAYFLAASSYTAADVLTKVKTVDGASSGLDADLLDGQEGAYYADVASRLGYTPLNWNTSAPSNPPAVGTVFTAANGAGTVVATGSTKVTANTSISTRLYLDPSLGGAGGSPGGTAISSGTYTSLGYVGYTTDISAGQWPIMIWKRTA